MRHAVLLLTIMAACLQCSECGLKSTGGPHSRSCPSCHCLSATNFRSATAASSSPIRLRTSTVTLALAAPVCPARPPQQLIVLPPHRLGPQVACSMFASGSDAASLHTGQACSAQVKHFIPYCASSQPLRGSCKVVPADVSHPASLPCALSPSNRARCHAAAAKSWRLPRPAAQQVHA